MIHYLEEADAVIKYRKVVVSLDVPGFACRGVFLVTGTEDKCKLHCSK